ncbi:MAG: hypothetical protein Q8S20_08070 [Sulfuritalea sp.]|nr:hypothetical protein [Sulfuritalea sp.]
MHLSTLDPINYGFDLNNREIAALIWLAVIALWILSLKQTRPSALILVRGFFVWPLQRVFLAMTAYTLGAVVTLSKLNLWEWTNLKTTVMWWLIVGFASIWQSLRVVEERGAFRRLLMDAVNLTAAITFIAEFGSFPLLLELLVPVPLTFIALMLAAAPYQPGAGVLVKPLTWITTMAGLGYVVWGVHEIMKAPSAFLNWNTLREFGDPILLSVAFIPFLYCLAVYTIHETTFTTLHIIWDKPKLAAYAKRRALWSFGADLTGMKRLARDLKINDIKDRKGVDDAIRQIKRLKRRERSPPTVPPDQGWSPYEAIRFLEAEGVLAGDWHSSFGEWRAEASVVKLDDGSLPDNVSFYLSGTELATTRLVLALHADNRNGTAAASDARFYAMVQALLARAMAPEEAASMLVRLQVGDVVIWQDGWRFAMKRDEWGHAKFGGYSRNFKMSHNAHVPNEFDDEFYEQPIVE